MRRALCVLLLAACSQQQIPTPQRNLNRPTDIAVACVTGQPGARNAVPPVECADKNTTGSASCDQIAVRTLGFITNSSSGEVAVAALADGGNGIAQLIDLDASRPGYNFLPVGRLPITTQTSSDGCRVFVANQGSCDFNSIDVGLVASGADSQQEMAGSVTQVQIHTAAGPLLARPRAMELLPRFGPDGTVRIGDTLMCNDATAEYRAYVAYPGCDLVAEVNLTTGDYIRGVFIHADGTVVDAGPTPQCPVECADQLTGPPPAGTPPPADGANVSPVTLALDNGQPVYLPVPTSDSTTQMPKCCPYPDQNAPPGSCRSINEPYQLHALYVGGTGSRTITRINLMPDGSFGTADKLELDSCPPPQTSPPPANPLPGCDPIGVTRLRLGPPVNQALPNSAGHFLYAIALDQSIRVVDVTAMRECETQADPQMVNARYPATSPTDPLSGLPAGFANCLPLDDQIPPPAGAPPLRRAITTGPGIRLTGTPIDVAFAHVNPPTSATADPTALTGTFAYVLGSSGLVTVVNLDTPKATTAMGQVSSSNQSHTVHNRNFLIPGDLTLNDPTSGGAAVAPETILIAMPSNVGAQQTDAPVLANLARNCPTDPTPTAPAIHFPDTQTPRPETWSVSYQGLIPNLLRSGGTLLEDTPSTLVMLDPGASYCSRGAMPGDYVFIAGCADNTQCQTGLACFGIVPGETGICLPYDQDSSGVQTPKAGCGDLMISRHEYRVTSTFSGSLVLDEKPLVVPRPGGCTSDADCQGLDIVPANGKALFPNKNSIVCDPTPWPGTNTRQCVVTCAPPTGDSNSWTPHDEQCQPNADFGSDADLAGLYVENTGYVCGHDALGGDPSKPRRCVAARIPRAPYYDYDPRVGQPIANQCFVLPMVYEVHAGLSMLMTGDHTGYLHNQIEAADGSCVADPTRGPKMVGRLSYNAPICQTPADLDMSGGLGYDTYESGFGTNGACVWNATKPLVSPNPCLRRAYPAKATAPILVWNVETPIFEAAVGPAARLDGNNNPLSPAFGTVYSFTFTINGGFAALLTPTNAFLPAVIHAGPMFPSPPGGEWMYLIDEGDQVNQTLQTVLTGQMVRVAPDTLVLDPNTSVQ